MLCMTYDAIPTSQDSAWEYGDMSIHSTASITRKRTRDDAEAIELDARPIVITVRTSASLN